MKQIYLSILIFALMISVAFADLQRIEFVDAVKKKSVVIVTCLTVEEETSLVKNLR
jgi:uncharacterized membrane protein YwzB